jgi:hypothetical protein
MVSQPVAMSSRKRKDEVRAIRDAEDRLAMRRRVRHPHDEIFYPGVGRRLVQLVHIPSFARTVAWEVRESGERLVLFRSHSPAADQYLLVDHVRFEASSDMLRAMLAPLSTSSILAFPDMPGFGVADGTTIELALDVGSGTSVRVAWCEGHAPSEWDELVRAAAEMLSFFQSAAPAEAPLDFDKTSTSTT